jgi:hypothetical protein
MRRKLAEGWIGVSRGGGLPDPRALLKLLKGRASEELGEVYVRTRPRSETMAEAEAE